MYQKMLVMPEEIDENGGLTGLDQELNEDSKYIGVNGPGPMIADILSQRNSSYDSIIRRSDGMIMQNLANQNDVANEMFGIHRTELEFSLPLDDLDRRLLYSTMKSHKIRTYTDTIDYGTRKYVGKHNGILNRLFHRILSPVPPIVQADYVKVSIWYTLNRRATEYCQTMYDKCLRGEIHANPDDYDKCVIDRTMRLHFFSSQFPYNAIATVVPHSSRGDCCIYDSNPNNIIPRCMDFATKDNAEFHLWMMRAIQSIVKKERECCDKVVHDVKHGMDMDLAEVAKLEQLALGN